MKKQLAYILLTLLATSSQVVAQQSKLDLAQKKHNQLAYSESIKIYEDLAKSGYKSKELLENLANAYYYKADFVPAKRWYDSLYVFTQDLSANTFSKYVSTLKTQQEYAKADLVMAQMGTKYPDDSRVKLYAANTEYLKKSKKAPTSASVINAGINSVNYDFSPAFLGDSAIVFSSTRATQKALVSKHNWTGESYTNLYTAILLSKKGSQEKDSTSIPKGLNGQINKFYNESSAVFTKDGKTMFFTRNNQLKVSAKTDTLHTVLLKIYKATYDGKKWGSVKELPFNNDNYSCAHPALSADEKELYFSSNQPGSKGMSDIYKVAILENDTYGAPENLGNQINTEGRETFPFITKDNILIFASDARAGLGGLDLYYVHLDSKNKEIKTFGAPINSPQDDFGLIYKDALQDGFFTSNRTENNLGKDDIYRFRSLELPKLFKVIATVLEETTKSMLTAQVTLFDEFKNSIAQITAVDGMFEIPDLEQGKNYVITIAHPDFETFEGPVVYKGKETNLVFELKKKELELSEVDLARILGIRIIYFDLDKHFIRTDAALELQKVADIMKQYPQMRIDVRSHTDSRSAAVYNQQLSQRRANATRAWLISQGIAPERLTAHGYGESKLVNECADGVTCSDAEHQINRRSEFIIIE
ncbi:OmpA family protein [Flavobacterium sp.]|jgi:outer membrane protein OmpA-like peptidoglycan-associated protein|uniref:OmpA family protein n=1 Tax=Flavobacterium sp. TaxID=239 RepID=UPI0037BEDA79